MCLGFVAALTWYVASPTALAADATSAPQISWFGSMLELAFGLLVVGLLMLILFRFVAKRTNIQQRGTIQVIAARQLAPNKSVQVVEIGEKRYLLGVGEDVRLLAEVTESYLINGSETEHAFSNFLSQALSEIRQGRQDADDGDQ